MIDHHMRMLKVDMDNSHSPLPPSLSPSLPQVSEMIDHHMRMLKVDMDNSHSPSLPPSGLRDDRPPHAHAQGGHGQLPN